jgi:hypothetical protein
VGVSILERIESKTMWLPDLPGCWLFIGSQNARHYGHMCITGSTVAVHRLSYEIHFGPIPPGMDVLHLCDTPSCWRPDHLYAGTKSQNMRDAVTRGRLLPHHHPRTFKVTADQVLKIRQRESELGRVLACEYGVSESNISLIRRRHTWASLG